MGTGEAIAFGEGVSLPTRIKFDILPAGARPQSNTASFTRSWADEMPDDGFLQGIVQRWRAQSHAPDATPGDSNRAPDTGLSFLPVEPTIPEPRRATPQREPTAAAAFRPPRDEEDLQSLAALMRKFRS
jgi:hypothetical protein